MHGPVLKFVDTVCKTVVISLVSLHFTQKKFQDVQLELLQDHIKFHPDKIKSVERIWSQEVLLSADLVTPRQGQGQWKWYNMVEVIGVHKHGRYEQICVEQFACNVQCFLPQKMPAWTAVQPNTNYYIDLYLYDTFIWIKNRIYQTKVKL